MAISFDDLLALYFGEPYEKPYLRIGREIWLKLQTQRYRDVYWRTRVQVAKERGRRMVAEMIQKRSPFFEAMKADHIWSGSSLTTPFPVFE